MKIAEAKEQKLATMKKNMKMVVVALMVLAIEKMIDMVANLFTDSDIRSCPNSTVDSHSPAI